MVAPARLPAIIKLLDGEYSRRRWQPRLEPVEELVFTILSQNTTDVNAERSLASLRAKYPSWEDVARAPVRDIAAAIRSGGLADAKARYIKETLREILLEHGDLTLGFLNGMNNREALGYLTRYPGVGIKTASCVILFALGRPVMPVDTHVFRVTQRLGFIGTDVGRDPAHGIITAITPDSDIYSFHLNLVAHGRRICKAQRPRCQQCVLARLCPSEIPSIT